MSKRDAETLLKRIDELCSEIPDGFAWSNKMRRAYENATALLLKRLAH